MDFTARPALIVSPTRVVNIVVKGLNRRYALADGTLSHNCEPMITHRDLKTLNLLISTVAYNPDELSPAPAPKSNGPPNVIYKRVIKGQ